MYRLHTKAAGKGGGGGGRVIHLATLMHSRLCHLLYNHVICIEGGKRFCQGVLPPLCPLLNEALQG